MAFSLIPRTEHFFDDFVGLSEEIRGGAKLLKQMMTWATMVYENGRPLLDRNPLAGYVVPKEPNPNRPVLDGETVEKLLAVADQVSPLFALLTKLMDLTGWRVGSVQLCGKSHRYDRDALRGG